jgi:hypothetical protein
VKEHFKVSIFFLVSRPGCSQQPLTVRCNIDEVTLNVLPDNVLLEIFNFYKDHPASLGNSAWSWRTLIHVCRRWRHVIFGSPRRLDLRLHCSDSTPTRRLLDIWLPFPITVSLHSYINMSMNEGGLENILAALECRDRTSVISICYHKNRSRLEKLMTMLDKPFPILTDCHLISSDFLNRCQHFLRHFWVDRPHFYDHSL